MVFKHLQISQFTYWDTHIMQSHNMCNLWLAHIMWLAPQLPISFIHIPLFLTDHPSRTSGPPYSDVMILVRHTFLTHSRITNTSPSPHPSHIPTFLIHHSHIPHKNPSHSHISTFYTHQSRLTLDNDGACQPMLRSPSMSFDTSKRMLFPHWRWKEYPVKKNRFYFNNWETARSYATHIRPCNGWR